MNKLVFGLVSLATATALADEESPEEKAAEARRRSHGLTETCYDLSKDGKSWSRTLQRICVGPEADNVEITLRSGAPSTVTVATFRFDRKPLPSSQCATCNRDWFGLTNPDNAILNLLEIRFNGKRTKSGDESGTVTIGKTKFFYRSVGK